MEQDQLRGWVGQLPQDEVFRELLIAQVESYKQLEESRKQLNKIGMNTLVIGGLMVVGAAVYLIGILMSL
jgi:hypothetical protein